jgi:hypothetical protein
MIEVDASDRSDMATVRAWVDGNLAVDVASISVTSVELTVGLTNGVRLEVPRQNARLMDDLQRAVSLARRQAPASRRRPCSRATNPTPTGPRSVPSSSEAGAGVGAGRSRRRTRALTVSKTSDAAPTSSAAVDPSPTESRRRETAGIRDPGPYPNDAQPKIKIPSNLRCRSARGLPLLVVSSGVDADGPDLAAGEAEVGPVGGSLLVVASCWERSRGDQLQTNVGAAPFEPAVMVSFQPDVGPAMSPVLSIVTPVGSVSSAGEAPVMSVSLVGYAPLFV